MVYYREMLLKRIKDFLDKIERKIRGKLSHHPFLYAFLGGTGVVLFWRGIWHAADSLNLSSSISIIAGTIILVLTGVFVSEFIGKKLIISGLAGEKKIIEKEETEIKKESMEIKKEATEIQTEETQLKKLQNTLDRVEKKISELEEEVEGK